MASDVGVDASRTSIERVLLGTRCRRSILQVLVIWIRNASVHVFHLHHHCRRRCSDAVYRQAALYLERHQIGNIDAASQFLSLADKVARIRYSFDSDLDLKFEKKNVR